MMTGSAEQVPNKPSLAGYHSGNFNRGRGFLAEAAWLAVQAIFVASPIPGSFLRTAILRAFGAELGKGVVIRPRIRVKFPWKLAIGDNCWIGEGVWIDNLAPVRLGKDVCISQGAYLCTGSHDWAKTGFDLITLPIEVHNHAWIAARAIVGPGAVVHEGAVLGLGSIATGDLQAWTIYRGGPAVPVKSRVVSSSSRPVGRCTARSNR